MKNQLVSKKTYRGSGSVHVDINVAHVNMKITRNFNQRPDPLVQGVGGEVVLGGAHEVVAPRVVEHQAIPMLKWLDPLGEPRHGQVLACQALFCQFADPPNRPC
jgi:hypothetical protein